MIITKHSRRATSLAKEFSKWLNYKNEEVNQIAMGATFHDIGKAYIPTEILELPRRLTRKEFEIIKLHPVFGSECLKQITDNEIILNMCLYHHERWDGTGYPSGLKGEEIPKEAMIMALCDVYEALTSDRYYKNKIEVYDAIEIIRVKLGNHFDPIIGQKFIDFIKDKIAKNENHEKNIV